MASMTVDLPDPVGPTRAKKSTPSKSISVGSRKAPKPSISRRERRIRPALPLASSSSSSNRRDQPVVVDALLARGRRRTARAA